MVGHGYQVEGSATDAAPANTARLGFVVPTVLVGAIAHCCARFLRLRRENPTQSRLSDSGQSRRLRVGESESVTQSQVSL